MGLGSTIGGLIILGLVVIGLHAMLCETRATTSSRLVGLGIVALLLPIAIAIGQRLITGALGHPWLTLGVILFLMLIILGYLSERAAHPRRDVRRERPRPRERIGNAQGGEP